MLRKSSLQFNRNFGYTSAKLLENLDKMPERFDDIPLQRVASTKKNNEILISSNVNMKNIYLNRPEALNALNLTMIRSLVPMLHRFEDSYTAQIILLRSEHEKAFCAGGDIRFLYENGKTDVASTFFREEYRMNYLLSTMETPIISILNGITMGGGVGLSVHGRFRVATENATFAMPETAIGFFPDVGSSHFLPKLGEDLKLEKSLGMYLGLCGIRLKGEELAALGVATHYIESKYIDEVEENLTSLKLHSKYLSSKDKFDAVDSALQKFEMDDATENVNDEFVETIQHVFGNKEDTVADIMNRLEKLNTKWSNKTLQKLKKASPISLLVTHRMLREGQNLSMKECLQMEYRIACRMMNNPDFYTGVDAMVISKSRQPKWKYDTIQDVPNDEIDAFFQPLQQELKLLQHVSNTVDSEHLIAVTDAKSSGPPPKPGYLSTD